MRYVIVFYAGMFLGLLVAGLMAAASRGNRD